jgi:alpha-galactosidase/6-phospho-beta-glucosidase family protein
MANLKIVLVGGGSTNWTPRVICNLLANDYLRGGHVELYDINAEALALTAALADRYCELAGSPMTVGHTTDRAAALDGASAVVVTIATGGLRAMRQDLEIPERYGIFQTVGDTVGPGGLVRSLRNVPVFLDLARAMEEHCPTAWMLNCSNPLCALTRVVCRETSIRALGVCHGVGGSANSLAQFLGVEIDRTSYVNTGVDHCAWFTDFVVDGQSAIDRLTGLGVEPWLSLPPKEAEDNSAFGSLYPFRCGITLGLQLGVLPAIGDRHLMEFLPGYLAGQACVERFGLVRTTVDERETRAMEAGQRIERLLRGEDELKLESGGDDVAGWIAALFGGPIKEDNVSAPNEGQIAQLPMGAIVETRGVLDGSGCHPLVSPMPPQVEAIVRPHSLREELIIDAALEGNPAKALSAMASDPLVGAGNVAREMLQEMVAANREWLPRFA